MIILRSWLILRNDTNAALETMILSDTQRGRERSHLALEMKRNLPLGGIIDAFTFQTIAIPNVVLVFLVELVI